MDPLDKFLAKKKKNEPPKRQVNPYEYPDRTNMTMPSSKETWPEKFTSVTTTNDPIVEIKTISDDMFKRVTGENSKVDPKIIRVMSPVFTTQPQISFERDDIQDGNTPVIRVVEGGKGTPEATTPFINPYATTHSNCTSSLIEEGKADTRGSSLSPSTTPAYDAMKARMGGLKVNIDGQSLDILLPIDARRAEDEASGIKVSIGGVPGVLGVNSKENIDKKPKVGTKIPTKPLMWDEQNEA